MDIFCARMFDRSAVKVNRLHHAWSQPHPKPCAFLKFCIPKLAGPWTHSRRGSAAFDKTEKSAVIHCIRAEGDKMVRGLARQSKRLFLASAEYGTAARYTPRPSMSFRTYFYIAGIGSMGNDSTVISGMQSAACLASNDVGFAGCRQAQPATAGCFSSKEQAARMPSKVSKACAQQRSAK